MPLIKKMSGIPLYTTIREALDWANENGLIGYHTHSVRLGNKARVKGYMGGRTHSQATGSPVNAVLPTPIQPPPPVQPQPVVPPPVQQQQTPQPTPIQINYGSGSGGSGGGGGGGY